jgi:hypothetical protein
MIVQKLQTGFVPSKRFGFAPSCITLYGLPTPARHSCERFSIASNPDDDDTEDDEDDEDAAASERQLEPVSVDPLLYIDHIVPPFTAAARMCSRRQLGCGKSAGSA